MPEQREQCCGNCWWWMRYASSQCGLCYRDGSWMLPSEVCSQWEHNVYDDDPDEDDEPEEADNDA